MEIEEIIIKLFSRIRPIGETNEDENRYNNLEKYEKSLKIIIEELSYSANYRNDNRYSVNRIGEKAYNILEEYQEYIKSTLEENCNE